MSEHQCIADGARDADEIVQRLIARATAANVDWWAELPEGKAQFSAREIVNAIGRAFTKAGVPNNLEKP